MKTIIMAGGKGTRISSIASDIPKPMIKIAGKPVLEHEIMCLKSQGFTDLIITVSHLAEQIVHYFGDGSQLGVNIKYFIEKQPLGNGGALFKLKNELTGDFLLLNADAVFNVDFNRLIDFHRKKGGFVTLFSHSNSHPYDSGLLIADADGCVQRWLSKEDIRPKWYKNCVNGGLHVINPAVLDMIDINPDIIGTSIKVDLDRQVLKPLCGTGKMFCYDSPEYVKDMGTPERYEEVCKDFAEGIVKAKSLTEKQKAIFLDRDGTINKYVGFLRRVDDFELLPGVSDAIRKINLSGYLAIVVTNQPVIARGEVSFNELRVIHNKMETLLGHEGAFIDKIYFCPHHPHNGFEGEVPELKVECNCRKPKPGMLLQAAKDFNIDLSRSWMIGDGKNDIEAGKTAGCLTALIGNEKFGQDLTGSSLQEIIDFLF